MRRNLIISCKVLTITVISNEKLNQLVIYLKSCRNVTMFDQKELASLYQLQEKLRACRNSKQLFYSSHFIANDIHIKITCPFAVLFNAETIFYFWDFYLSKHHPKKGSQNCFHFSIIQIKQAACKFPNYRLLLAS